MRALTITISAFIAMATQTQAMDWDPVTVKGGPTPPQAAVSFSIGCPKGWISAQNYQLFGWTCSYSQSATNTARAAEEHGHMSYLIWPSYGGSAAEAAATFFNDEGDDPAYTQKNMTEVKTSAGDSGWLVESEGYLIQYSATTELMNDAFLERTNPMNELLQSEKPAKDAQKIPVIYHDFFFHSGKSGAIRIQIMTDTADATRRSQLDDLALETLRFNSR